MSKKLSIIIPVYNEQELIREIVHRVLGAQLPEGWTREVIVVDDGSDDGTGRLLQEAIKSSEFPPEVILFSSIINHGKGSALRAGFKIATGDVILVQDGDLEYDPVVNYPIILHAFNDSSVDIVFGSRFLKHWYPDGMALKNWCANIILTWMTKILFASKITDEATGYKVFKKSVLNRLTLECRGFDFCPEFTAKAHRLGFKIAEVPITYKGRNILQGKKIKFTDGLEAIYTLLKFRFKKI